MSLNIENAISRPLGVAQKLLKNPVNKASVYSKTVILTGERITLLTENGRWCFLDALTILPRVVGNLVVILPSGLSELEQEVREICTKVWSQGSIKVISGENQKVLEAGDAILNVGTNVMPNMPWTAVNSNGWVARASSRASSLPCDVDQPNPLGAMMAASLGVTEIFKRIFSVPDEIAPPLEKTEFSLFELTTSPTWIGPPLPNEIHLPDTLLVGAGAIGNGNALLLSQLPLRGRVHIVDKQDYAEENLGTCVLLGRDGWLGKSKAIRLADWLSENSKLDVTGEKSLIEDAKSGCVVPKLAIDLVLNGLDDVNARRDTQELWPSVIIDGGINEIGAAVIQHRLDQEGHACLKCWFEPKKIDEKQVQSQLTGLATSSLGDMERVLTDDDIACAAESKRTWLSECKKQGKTLCSIISEAALSSKLGVDVEEGFKPSAPFVATAAAAMVLAEAIKALEFPSEQVASIFQIGSLFIGPEESSRKFNRYPSGSCQCVVHRDLIVQLQANRARKQMATAFR